MIRLLTQRRFGPIGVDVGARSVKLVQLTADHRRVVDAVRWDFPGYASSSASGTEHNERLTEALIQSREGRSFRGRDAVVCVGREDLFLQSLRVPKASKDAVRRLAQQEAAGRLPYPLSEAELQVVPVAEVRQQDALLTEVLLFACHRDRLRRQLDAVERAGLNPVAVDIEPAALLRGCRRQYRREEDRDQRLMYVHLGCSSTAVVIAEGDDALFVKYIDLGGQQMDEAVAHRLDMSAAQANALRKHNGDRRADQQDPEITQSIATAVRPIVERLAAELAMCVRYHSVTFRGRPLARMILGGGEAISALAGVLDRRLEVQCELANPLRPFGFADASNRSGQWDVAAGLALKQIH